MESSKPAQTLTEVGALLRERSPELREAVHSRLFAVIPDARRLFPADLAQAHSEFPRALAWTLEHALIDDSPNPDAVSRLREAGIEHRRHGFPADTYQLLSRILRDAVPEVLGDDISPELMHTTLDIISQICVEMADAATQADRAGIPAAHAAQVVSVRPADSPDGYAVVTLESPMAIEYAPGQVIPATPMPQVTGQPCAEVSPAEWLRLTPAHPANPFGQLEVHVPADFPANPGDYWTLGAPSGGVDLDPDQDQWFIVLPGGDAAAIALTFALLEQDARPQVLITHTGTLPAALRSLAMTADWLTVEEAGVQGIVEKQTALLGREIVICGERHNAEQLAMELVLAGAESIQLAAPTLDDQWPEPK